MLLRARTVLPIVRPPIENGAVLISGKRIAAVGRWDELAGRARSTVDLGEAILMPGLINAHCHLDYTDMAGQFLPPKSFTDWIKLITAAKGGWTYSDFAQSWLRGAQMLLRTGTTAVADVEAVPELLPEVWTATPLRVFSFLELTGVQSRRQPRAIVQAAVRKMETLRSSRCRAGLSPHAPYSTVPELLRLAAATACERHWQLTIHLAESVEENEMFAQARGAMFDWLRRNERDMSDCGLGSPVQHLERIGALGDNLLAVHVNHLAHGDATLLGRRRVSVVHCPRSHDFFGHAPFPRAELSAAGVNICLGTDSLATVRKNRKRSLELNLFDEMRVLARNAPDLSPANILKMVTFNPAWALGMQGAMGEVSRNALADLIVVPAAGKSSDPCEALLQHDGNVAASMIGGQWAIPPSN